VVTRAMGSSSRGSSSSSIGRISRLTGSLRYGSSGSSMPHLDAHTLGAQHLSFSEVGRSSLQAAVVSSSNCNGGVGSGSTSAGAAAQ
jgi:hypothetical protein